jgi:pimeloyl-ACP methyl ester carboxylesterase
MEAALYRLIEPWKISGLIFFGHSGGGTLAMLLAERFSQTRGVVTLAGNLDPDAWTRHHEFSPLLTSLNPARRTVPDVKVLQLHLLGGRDENIPPSLSYAALERQSHARIRLIPDFDHNCCWHWVWPEVLESLPDE